MVTDACLTPPPSPTHTHARDIATAATVPFPLPTLFSSHHVSVRYCAHCAADSLLSGRTAIIVVGWPARNDECRSCNVS